MRAANIKATAEKNFDNITYFVTGRIKALNNDKQ